jgi:hypothetical protein
VLIFALSSVSGSQSQDTGITRLVSIGFDSMGNAAVGDGESRSSCISANGRYVAFASKASNLLWPLGQDINGSVQDVFLRDLVTHQTYLVSRPHSYPGSGANGASNNPFITPDGAFLVFDSEASNLVSGDSNGVIDVFLVDLRFLPSSLPPAVLVSVSNAEELGNGNSFGPNMSDDGSVVAFSSTADNLTSDSPNTPGQDIYVRDLTDQTTTLVSVNGSGEPANTNQSEDQAISGDGRYVVFWSGATNLDRTPELDGYDSNDDYDVFIFDRQAPSPGAEIVSMNMTGNSGQMAGPPQDRASAYPCISGNGRYVSFISSAADLVVNDTNTGPDVFVRDMLSDSTVLVNLNPQHHATMVPGVVDNGTINQNGRYLTFYGGGMQYGSHDTNPYWDVYLIDRDRDGNGLFDKPPRLRRVSVGPRGEEGNAESVSTSFMSTISRSGNFVVFESLASNFTGSIPDTSGAGARYDVFVRDMRKARRR